jgi:hypothetical protein
MLSARWTAAISNAAARLSPGSAEAEFKPTTQLEHSDHAGVSGEPADEMPFVRPWRAPERHGSVKRREEETRRQFLQIP